jgi:cleavage and polyadenylation specificity factor subunit 5
MTLSTKEAQPEEDPSVSARLQRLQNNYEDFGMRRTVEGVLVVHDHGHPHILMLQIANAFFKLYVLLVFCIFIPLTSLRVLVTT